MEIVSHPRQTENKRPIDPVCRCLAPKGDRVKMHGGCCSRPELCQQLASRWTGAPARGALPAGGEPTPETISPPPASGEPAPHQIPAQHLHALGGRGQGKMVSFPGPGWLHLPGRPPSSQPAFPAPCKRHVGSPSF